MTHYFPPNSSLPRPARPESSVPPRRGNLPPPRRSHPQHAAGVQLDALARAHHRHKRGGVDRGFRMEAKRNLLSLPLNGGDAKTLTHGFEDGILQKVIHGDRRRAKAIFEFLSNVGLFFVGGNGGNALVSAQAEIFAGNIVMRNAHVEAEAKGSAEIASGLFALELRNSPLENLTIEGDAEGFNVAVLLSAEHIACSA